jgi:hypothetical protein
MRHLKYVTGMQVDKPSLDVMRCWGKEKLNYFEINFRRG